jgi:hypothetical protein
MSERLSFGMPSEDAHDELGKATLTFEVPAILAGGRR